MASIAWKGLQMVVGHVQVTTSDVLQESQHLDHMLLQTWVLEQMDGTGINRQFWNKWAQLIEI